MQTYMNLEFNSFIFKRCLLPEDCYSIAGVLPTWRPIARNLHALKGKWEVVQNKGVSLNCEVVKELKKCSILIEIVTISIHYSVLW